MFEKETGERFTFLLLVKRLTCKSLLLICLDQFNPVVLSGNVLNLHVVLGLELAGCLLCSTMVYQSLYVIQKKCWSRNVFLFICCNQWNSDVWGEIGNLKSRLVEANTNPYSEIRDLICCLHKGKYYHLPRVGKTHNEYMFIAVNGCPWKLFVLHLTSVSWCSLAPEVVTEREFVCWGADWSPAPFWAAGPNSQQVLKGEQPRQLWGQRVVWGIGHRVATAADPPVVVRSMPHWLWVLFLYNTLGFPSLTPLIAVSYHCSLWFLAVWIGLGACLLQLQFCLSLFS